MSYLHGGLQVVDALLFQFTSFTTIGYGSHPRAFEEPFHQVGHCLCLVFPLPSWLRHCLCLVCSTTFVAKTLPFLADFQMMACLYILGGMLILGVLAGAVGQSVQMVWTRKAPLSEGLST